MYTIHVNCITDGRWMLILRKTGEKKPVFKVIGPATKVVPLMSKKLKHLGINAERSNSELWSELANAWKNGGEIDLN